MPAPNPAYTPNLRSADGSITLAARTAEVHGVMLRYEPLPHKNTLGFWTRVDDWASWEFEIKQPGKFTVEVLQGCGAGQGGSVVEITVAGQRLTFTVEDTGHYQNFKARQIGTVTLLDADRYGIMVKARSKPGVAVMDLRELRLKPVRE